MDWLSRLFETMPVRGRLDLRCSYGVPWRIEQGPGEPNEIPYHTVLAGSAILDDPAGSRPLQLKAGDILLLPGNPRHVMHDCSGAAPLPARNRTALNFTISENLGSDERLDLLCGHFAITPPHDRLLRSYLPPRLVVHAGAAGEQKETAAQLAGLVTLMRRESADDHLGGRAMLNALSTAMFALVLRLASETEDAPRGILALAGHPRLLLTDIRMTMAANELRRSSLSTGAVAEAVGYQSEAAFQRAFKSHMGITPAQWRKTQEATGQEVFARPAAAAAGATPAETAEVDSPSRAGQKRERRSR